jgi:two-component system response regulator AtoC
VRPLVVVLAVVHDPEMRSLIRTLTDGEGYRLIEAGSYSQAQLLLSNGFEPDLLLVDSCQFETAELHKFLESAPIRHICLVTGAGEPMPQNKASQLGVTHQLRKPVRRADIESLIAGLTRSSHPGLCDDGAYPPEAAHAATRCTPADASTVLHLEELGENRFFLAASSKMLEIHRQAKMLANVDVNVLILGESGTGKEVIAHLIHKHSRRSSYRFQKVNCAALPEHLLESELFGHDQGAFTGANKDRQGRFEQANRSTLLLDEIGEIGPQMQAKLLHVLQDGYFSRLGGKEATKVDVRVLAATNIDMESALQERTFREDLYYRLSVVTINIPPLRERREEIPYLIEETIRRAPAEMKEGGVVGFSSRLMDAAYLYDWRGNLRELRNFVTRTLVLRDQDAAIRELETRIATMDSANIDPSVPKPPERADMRSIVRDLTDRTEVRMIQDALDASGWNRRSAARQLNISYRGLLYKIQQYRLAPRRSPEYSPRDNAV